MNNQFLRIEIGLTVSGFIVFALLNVNGINRADMIFAMKESEVEK